MRRTPWFRALASYLALWFPLVIGEPGLLQPCPMHGALAAASASSAPAPTHSHHAAATAQGGHADHVAASTNGPTHDHHGCTCIGSCAGSAAVALATSPPDLPVLTVAHRPASILPSGERLARPAPSFSRPYTTGPPRA